jgi:hypothetical protein
MLEILAGISFAFVVLELADEWHQRHLSKRRLAVMRGQVPILGRPWDTLRGRWIESPAERPADRDITSKAAPPTLK